MLNAILLRVVLFLCARKRKRADENSRGKEVMRRERHKKGLLFVDDDSCNENRARVSPSFFLFRRLVFAIQGIFWLFLGLLLSLSRTKNNKVMSC